MSDPVEIVIEGKDEFSSAFKSANDSIDTLEKKTGGASSALDGVTGAMAGLATGGVALVAGALVGAGVAAFDFASDMEQGQRDIQAALGVTADEADNLGGVAQDVFANNWGDSIGDVSQALIDVRQQMKGLADKDLESATEAALALRDSFGVDVAESTNAANTLMKNFGLTSQQAFDFVTKGMQSGLNASGDFLDTIGEYSTQFKNGGASADQFFSLLQSGVQGGMLGTDKAADAFKEFRVRIQDGSDATSTALAQLGIDSKKLATDMASGNVSAADAFQMVLGKLNGIDDQNLRMQAGVGLLGTQFEDLGTEAALKLSLAGTSMEDLAGATDSLNAKYGSLSSVGEGLWRQLLVTLAPVGEAMLEFANAVMPYVLQGFTFLKEGITQAVTIIRTVVSTVFGFLNSFLVSDSGEMSADLTALWVQLQAAITLAAQFIQSTIVPIFQAIAAFFVAHKSEVSMIFGTLWDMIMIIIKTAIGLITGIIQAFMALAKGDFIGFGQAITGIVKTFTDGVWNLFSTWLNLLYKLWLELWTKMKVEFQRILDSIAPWILQTMDACRNTILQSINGIAGAAKSLGSNIINAIKDGVSSGVGALVGAVKEAASRALQAAKDFLGIHSPSKAFYEIGEYTMQGWGEAIADNMGMVNRAITDAGASTLATASMASSAGSTGGGAITIMPGAIAIYGAAGMNEQGIADAVLARLSGLIESRA